MQRPDNAQLLTQADALNKLFDEKAFSWTLAMENLETVLPGGVQVSTLEPVRAKDGHITLHLRVDGPRDRAVDLVRNLEHSRRFLEPRIVGESSAETSTGPNQRLEPVSASNRFNFDLLAEYNPPSPDEDRMAAPSSKKAIRRRTTPTPARRRRNRQSRVRATSRPAALHRSGPQAQSNRQPRARRPAMSNGQPASPSGASASSRRSPGTTPGSRVLLLLVIGLVRPPRLRLGRHQRQLH